MDTNIAQTSLPGFCPIEAAVSAMAGAGIEARGAVFTRREVVEFILDLAGYTSDKPLHQMRLLEPSMGQGDFLTPVIERLLASHSRLPAASRRSVVDHLGDCITAVELHQASYDQTFELVRLALRAHGLNARDARAHDSWTAYREGAFGNHAKPFIGWLAMIEDADKSRRPGIRESSQHFPIFPEFKNVSYLGRYDLLCQKLVKESLYTAACTLASPREAVTTGAYADM